MAPVKAADVGVSLLGEMLEMVVMSALAAPLSGAISTRGVA